MQIPTFKMINENLIADINGLNQMYEKNHQFNIKDLTSAISVDKPINENFDVILKYLQDKKDDSNLNDQQKILLNGVFLYTHNYIALNNAFAQHLDKENNFELNKVIVDIFHNRYREMKPIFEKEEYLYSTEEILKLTNELLELKTAQEIGMKEDEILKLFPTAVEKLINDKKLTQQDDIIFSSFSIGGGIIKNYLNRFFEYVSRANAAAQEANGPTVSVETKDEKILTKSIEDYYKENNKK